MSAPAVIASAVEDALAATAAHIDELPITPGMIWRLLHEAES
jgi:2-furoyl-CoA dehydrogenase large subunit